MKQWMTRPILMAGALSMIGVPSGGGILGSSFADAAPWIAPAPQQELSAKWVKDIARELRSPQFRNILMNIPGGSPQATILDYVNEAAAGMKNGEPEYARDLVRHAVNVLDRTAGRGWYSQSDIQPIQAMILRNAKRGFQEAGYTWNDGSKHAEMNNRNNDQTRERGVRLFNPDKPNYSGTRGDAYTGDHWQAGGNFRVNGSTFDRSPDGSQANKSRTPRGENMSYRGTSDRDSAYRDDRRVSTNRSSERGGTQRYYSDEFYYSDYPWEDRGRRFQNDARSSRGSSLSTRDFDQERIPREITQDRRQHAGGKASFYQQSAEDSGRQRPFDRGPGKDQYFESTTREHSRGYDR